MRKLGIIVGLFLCCTLQAQMRIISYNVENLFDTTHDSLKLDEDFTPEGKYKWSKSRYYRKIENISRVIVSICGWQNAAIVGLCEVENEQCLTDMVKTGGLGRLGYNYIHQESPDERGIDCALLYDPKQFKLLNSRFIPVILPEGERPTRDIVYASGEIKHKNSGYSSRTIPPDTLHIMMCHLPSQSGGTEQTAFKRHIAYRVLQQTVDSILSVQPQAKIVIMGDMNSTPTDRLRGMHNLMMPLEKTSKGGAGTHKWQGIWSYLDQFYVSESLYGRSNAQVYAESWVMERDNKYGGEQPMRCYKYLTWQPGYSDHLPIYLDIR